MDEYMKRRSRSTLRAAAADQAAANATAPISKRHRPSRPSPLAHSDRRVESPMMFANPVIGPSPPSSTERSTPATSDDSSHAYAAAAQGSWGINADDTSNEGGIDFSRGSYYDASGAEVPIALTPAPAPAPAPTSVPDRSTSAASGHYSHDPFAEYHQYIGGIEAGLDADTDTQEVFHPSVMASPGREPQNPQWL